jgi:hypothetical protein
MEIVLRRDLADCKKFAEALLGGNFPNRAFFISAVQHQIPTMTQVELVICLKCGNTSGHLEKLR